MTIETVLERLHKGEEKLRLFEEYRKDLTKPEPKRKMVAFAYLYELMAYTAILEFAPDYIPPREMQIQIAQAFAGTKDHVTVEDGQVVVNTAIIDQMEELKRLKEQKDKENGKVG